jgi:hypothetical protein
MAAALRTQIKSALFTILQQAEFGTPINGASTWLTSERRLRNWNQVDASQQPALFLVQHREGYETQSGLRQRRWLEVGAWCIAKSGDPSAGIIGDDLLDTMEEAIEALILPDNLSRNEMTLGGLAWSVRIDRQDGIFIRDPGDTDGQALLILPIRILLP